jgi:L-lactate dehydrogenase complex protein LldG
MVDSSLARKNILQRIRSASGRAGEGSLGDRASLADYLARHPSGPKPVMKTDLLSRFTSEAQKLSSTLERVPSADAVVAAAGAYLTGRGLSLDVAVAGALAGLDWASAGIQARSGGARDADLVGVSRAFCGVAETGSLVFLSGRESPATLNLLPETHLAVLAEERIVACLEDAFDLIRHEQGELPRAVNFISGPSRTGDIEQTIVLGAHGPYRVHIFVVAAP